MTASYRSRRLNSPASCRLLSSLSFIVSTKADCGLVMWHATNVAFIRTTAVVPRGSSTIDSRRSRHLNSPASFRATAGSGPAEGQSTFHSPFGILGTLSLETPQPLNPSTPQLCAYVPVDSVDICKWNANGTQMEPEWNPNSFRFCMFVFVGSSSDPFVRCLYLYLVYFLCTLRFCFGRGQLLAHSGILWLVRWSAAAVLLASIMTRVVDIMFGMNSTAQRNGSHFYETLAWMVLLPYLRMGM